MKQASKKVTYEDLLACERRNVVMTEALYQIGNLVGGPTMTYVPNIEVREWRARAEVISGIVVRATQTDGTQ